MLKCDPKSTGNLNPTPKIVFRLARTCDNITIIFQMDMHRSVDYWNGYCKTHLLGFFEM